MIQKEVHFPSDTALFYDALYQLAATGDWHYTEHALERMAPRTPAVMAELEKRALKRAVKEGYKPQTEDFRKWWNDNRPDPRNPPSVIEAEIACPGSTNIRVELNGNGDVITVIPRGKK